MKEALPLEGSIDLFMSETMGAGSMDEFGPGIFSRYAPCINRLRGSTIPYRARLSAAVVPLNQGVSHAPNGSWVAKYNFVINANGIEIPVIPEEEWKPLQRGMEIPVTDFPSRVDGELKVPADVTVGDFNMNYAVAVISDYTVNKGVIKLGQNPESNRVHHH